MILIVLGAIYFAKISRQNGVDSNNATLASTLRVQLGTWFEEKREYPHSLEEIWNNAAMRDYSKQYVIPEEQKTIFTYTGHSNWYELSFTNFGALKTQIGSNGLFFP